MCVVLIEHFVWRKTVKAKMQNSLLFYGQTEPLGPDQWLVKFSPFN